MDSDDVLVLGCGVSGLTTALGLQRAGRRVRIWAKSLPPDTTSNVAAAVWYPYRAYPVERVTAWGAAAYHRFLELAGDPASGVILSEVLDLRALVGPDPEWAPSVAGFRHAQPDELPSGYTDGFVFRAPVIDMSVYLEYLRRSFEQAGGQIERRMVTELDEAFTAYPIVVNCTGLGSRELVRDTNIHAARGQVIRIAHNGFGRALLDDSGPNQVAYIVPRLRDIVLGGVDDDHDERLGVDDAQSNSILRRCANLVEHFDPAFAASLRAHLDARAVAEPAAILGVAVGLRPVRTEVRLEVERMAPDRLLLHNYGHGGAGVTLSWGCADEIVRLLA